MELISKIFNIFDKKETIENILFSKPAIDIRQRPFKLPTDCQSCEHKIECGGGCARDVVLHTHDMGGKFHYCSSWMALFNRIKN